MSTTLITILGRTPKDSNGYRPTRYTFDDGAQTDPLAFFGWVPQQRLQPQCMVILDTNGRSQTPTLIFPDLKAR